MDGYYIDKLSVRKLWGYKNIEIQFFEDVNVIIGPNASGKTTLINILFDTLSANLSRLYRTDFHTVTIRLKEFSGSGVETVRIHKDGEELVLSVGNDSTRIPMVILQRYNEDTTTLDFQIRIATT